MSKTAVTAKRKSGKALNAANLKALGSERLAALVLELADDHPAAKRLLRLALAGESSAEDLAAEIDKRLETISQSQARVSWRRYREFVRDLELHRSAIAGRLAELDPNLALTLIVRFVATESAVSQRVKDAKSSMFTSSHSPPSMGVRDRGWPVALGTECASAALASSRRPAPSRRRAILAPTGGSTLWDGLK